MLNLASSIDDSKLSIDTAESELVIFNLDDNPSAVGIKPNGPFTNHDNLSNWLLRQVGTDLYILVTWSSVRV